MLPLDRDKIIEICLLLGSDIAGIANIQRFENAPKGHSPSDILPSCKSVIVIGCRFPKDSISKGTIHYTDVRNNLVAKTNNLAEKLAGILKEKGYKSKAIRSTGGGWIDGRFRSTLSLKHAGELAGLGKIGKNYLLTNNKYGNMLWLNAILTSLELEPDELADYTVCKKCNLCISKCPSGSLCSELFNQKACRKTCYKTIKGKLELRCRLCRTICPNRFGII